MQLILVFGLTMNLKNERAIQFVHVECIFVENCQTKGVHAEKVFACVAMIHFHLSVSNAAFILELLFLAMIASGRDFPPSVGMTFAQRKCTSLSGSQIKHESRGSKYILHSSLSLMPLLSFNGVLGNF